MTQLPLGTEILDWLSATEIPPPAHVVEVDDQIRASDALRLARQDVGMLWRGDYRGARQLLAALARRATPPSSRKSAPRPDQPAAVFHRYRRDQARRARLLGRLLVPLDPGFALPLRHAPDVRAACAEVYPPITRPAAVALRELLGVIGAHEWRRTGIPVAALGGARIHPHYGVFAPTRGEYVALVAEAPLPGDALAFDIGTGTGVLAAVLARRGVRHVVATDIDPRAVRCARDTMRRLGLSDQVDVRAVDLFPPGEAPLVVCNPPWLPAHPRTPLDRAVYDPESRMLRAFLTGLRAHLSPGGEGWLVLSNLAELLGLRASGALLAEFDAAGLRVIGRSDTPARHPAATQPDPADPLRHARAAEIVTLWRLAPAGPGDAERRR